MIIITIYCFLLLLLFTKNVNSININALAFKYVDENQFISPLIDKFNIFSDKYDLGVTVTLDLYKSNNSTKFINNHSSIIESFLQEKDTTYDLIFYDNVYSQRLGSYLLNLKKYLSKDLIDLYNNDIILQSCICEDKLVGLPVYIEYSVLCSNMKLLNKYSKRIPKTWDELLYTSKYILDKEKEYNDKLKGYNGFFVDYEMGSCSIYEYLYSCRDSKKDSFQEISNDSMLKALEMLKRIKNEISSDELFKSSVNYNDKLVMEGNILFYNSYYGCPINQNYEQSPLPGATEDLTGTYIGGYNIGINRYISKNKINAAIIVLQYLTSIVEQKNLIMNNSVFSGINSLYNDKEICHSVDCQFYKKLQFVGRPSYRHNNYDHYSKVYREHIYEFLYGDKSASEVLDDINEITKIHYITFNNSDKSQDSMFLGFIFAQILLISLYIMIFLSIFLFINKFENYFYFLNKRFWLLTILGSILILCAGITEIGPKMKYKCDIKLICICIGYSFIFLPILYILIAYYPRCTILTKWARRHKILFLFFLIIPDLLTFFSIFKSNSAIKEIKVDNGKYYEICKFIRNSPYLIITLIVTKLVILFVMTIFIYRERKSYSKSDDFRLLIIHTIINIVYTVIFLGIHFITFNNYRIYFVVQEVLIILFSVTNYILIYGIRIIWIWTKKGNTQISLLNRNNSRKSTNTDNDKSSLISGRSTYSRRLAHRCPTLDSLNSRLSSSFDNSSFYRPHTASGSPYGSTECLKQPAPNENLKQTENNPKRLSLLQMSQLCHNSKTVVNGSYSNLNGSNSNLNNISINIPKN